MANDRIAGICLVDTPKTFNIPWNRAGVVFFLQTDKRKQSQQKEKNERNRRETRRE